MIKRSYKKENPLKISLGAYRDGKRWVTIFNFDITPETVAFLDDVKSWDTGLHIARMIPTERMSRIRIIGLYLIIDENDNTIFRNYMATYRGRDIIFPEFWISYEAGIDDARDVRDISDLWFPVDSLRLFESKIDITETKRRIHKETLLQITNGAPECYRGHYLDENMNNLNILSDKNFTYENTGEVACKIIHIYQNENNPIFGVSLSEEYDTKRFLAMPGYGYFWDNSAGARVPQINAELSTGDDETMIKIKEMAALGLSEAEIANSLGGNWTRSMVHVRCKNMGITTKGKRGRRPVNTSNSQ